MATGHFCLKWNNFHNSIVTAFESLQNSEELVDVTLMCEGRNVKAHKVILSACSPYFRNLFKETPCQHPVIILKDVSHYDLVAILQFMYQGEVLVDQDGLSSFLKTAELLQVSGLAGGSSNTSTTTTTTTDSISAPIVSTSGGTVTSNSKCSTRTKSPVSNSPKSASIVKVRSDIVVPVVESKVEKENILSKTNDIDDIDESSQFHLPEDEPMQSCSYQSPEDVIIKTETTDDTDFQEMEYLQPIEDPGPTHTNEEQSILERSLKAQGISPHSTKLYSVDYNNQSTLNDCDLMKSPLLFVKTTVVEQPIKAMATTTSSSTTTTTLIETPTFKRKLVKIASDTSPSSKKMLVKNTLLPNVLVGETTKTCSSSNSSSSSSNTSNISGNHSPQSMAINTKNEFHGAQIGNCPHCSKMYSNQSALKYHVRLVHSDMLNMFCCHLCPESFEYRESYKTHMWDKHNVRN